MFRFTPSRAALVVALVTGGVAGLQPSTAAAADPPRGVAAAFGNTVKALYPDGKHQWLWFKPDGTWEAFGRRGKWSSGRWTQNGPQKVCLRQAKPIPIPFNYCTDFPSNGAVGVVWASKSIEGEPIRVTVVKGIQRP